MKADDLTAIEPFLAPLVAGMQPGARRKLASQIGRLLRRQNAQRIARNVDPDGAAMEPRKRRAARNSGKVRRKGKMFPQIRKTQAFRIVPGADGVRVGFINTMISATASTHHFGDVGFVGRAPDGSIVRTRYPARRLLGFGADDLDQVMDLVLDHVAGG